MLIYRIDNPSHWNHALYKRRVNRATIFIITLLLLTFCYTQVEVPCGVSPEQEFNYIMFTMGRYAIIGALAAMCVGIIFSCIYGLIVWLQGV